MLIKPYLEYVKSKKLKKYYICVRSANTVEMNQTQLGYAPYASKTTAMISVIALYVGYLEQSIGIWWIIRRVQNSYGDSR